RENRVRTDMAIVRDVRVGHEEVFVANRRLPATTGGAAVDGDEFAEEVVVADGQLGVLALVLEVLWRTADRSVAVKLVALADRSGSFDARERTDHAAAADGDVRTDDGVRADDDVGREKCV